MEYLGYATGLIVVIGFIYGIIRSVVINNKDTSEANNKLGKIIESQNNQLKINADFSSELRIMANSLQSTIKRVDDNSRRDEETEKRVNEMAQGLTKADTKIERIELKIGA